MKEEFVDNMVIRRGGAADAELVLDFIKAIADYERLAHEVVATADDIREALGGDAPVAEVLIAECGGEPAGFALFYRNFSTFEGRAGIHLEDLFVHPPFRGRGIGRALFHEVVGIAEKRGCPRVEWVALDWNTPAIDFYQAHGARQLDEWRLFRLNRPSFRDATD